MKYKNLIVEMLRQDVSIMNIADSLNLKKETVRKKINGKISISLEDCQTIANLFTENNEIDYLFKKF